MPKIMVSARLMSRRYVYQLIQFKEHEIFLAGIWYITGFLQVPFEVEKLSNSKSTYDAKKKFEILVNAVTSFSNKILSAILYIGLVITVLPIVYSAYLIFRVSFTNHIVEGWTTVVVSILLIGDVIVLFLGIIGMYIFKIFTETKNRPYTIVKDGYRKT